MSAVKEVKEKKHMFDVRLERSRTDEANLQQES